MGLVNLIYREPQFKTKKMYLTVHKWSIRIVIFIPKEYSLLVPLLVESFPIISFLDTFII